MEILRALQRYIKIICARISMQIIKHPTGPFDNFYSMVMLAQFNVLQASTTLALSSLHAAPLNLAPTCSTSGFPCAAVTSLLPLVMLAKKL